MIKEKFNCNDVYDPLKKSIVTADVWQDELGVVLRNVHHLGNGHIIAYTSHSDKRYAVTEKNSSNHVGIREIFACYF